MALRALNAVINVSTYTISSRSLIINKLQSHKIVKSLYGEEFRFGQTRNSLAWSNSVESSENVGIDLENMSIWRFFGLFGVIGARKI